METGGSALPVQVLRQNQAAVFVIMAVGAEVFPVAAVGGIVVVIAILVVDGEQVQVVTLELPAAFGADPAVQLQRLFAVAGIARLAVSLDAATSCEISSAEGSLRDWGRRCDMGYSPWREKR